MRLEGVSRAFVPERPALDRVSLEIRRGEVHALLGENGAGKTTLVNVLVGLVRPDAGALELEGRAVDLDAYDPAEAARRGVGMVHQHSALVPAMSVAENLAFGDPRAPRLYRPRRAARAVRRVAEDFGLAVSPERRVEDLAPGERQRAEILRALSRGARLLILDEPTAVLTPGETRSLFGSLRRLREAGRTVIFISHKLAEVEAIADRITILRRGRVAATLAAGAASAGELGRLMLGEDLPPLGALRRLARHEPAAGERRHPARPQAAQRAAGERRPQAMLEIRDLHAPGLSPASALRGIELRVGAGELVGVAGIDGNGQRELEEVLAGVRAPTRGEIRLGGRAVPAQPRALRRAGLAHLSGDRESAGLVPGFTVAENLVLKDSYDDRRYFPCGRFDLAAARRAALDVAARYAIRPPDPDLDVAALSGGNAQKLAVARELEAGPSVLVAVNPTRGLDVGSARFVHEQLLARAAAGAAVLLVSTELEEVLALADRLLALVRGRLRAIPAGAGVEEIGAVLLGEGAAPPPPP